MYETGASRISAWRLSNLCQVLGAAVDRFYEGLAAPAEPLYRRRLLGTMRHANWLSDAQFEALVAVTRKLAGADRERPG